ncbi:MAG TPA: STAS/SEC14 domain-containing protein [Vicinamibacterales bacterium]|jgi:hypothetical protein
MPYSVAEKSEFLLITVTGKITSADVHQLIDEAEAILKVRTTWAHTLVDLRGLDLSGLGFGDLIGLSSRRVSLQPPNAIRTAIVVESSSVTGYIRMLQNLNRNPDITIETFEDIAAARQWLTAAL